MIANLLGQWHSSLVGPGLQCAELLTQQLTLGGGKQAALLLLEQRVLLQKAQLRLQDSIGGGAVQLRREDALLQGILLGLRPVRRGAGLGK